MIFIDDCGYSMFLRGGGDIWSVSGNVHNHPSFKQGEFIYPSCPVKFDSTTDTFITKSGKEYHIMSYRDSKEKFVEQVVKDIKNGGYEIH